MRSYRSVRIWSFMVVFACGQAVGAPPKSATSSPLAAPAAPSHTQEISAVAAATSGIDEQVRRDLASSREDASVLRAQVELMREYNQDILQTIYWSIGTVFAFATLLVGLNLFGAKKIHDSDVKAIRENLHGQFLESKSEIEKSLRDATDSHKTELATAIEAGVKRNTAETKAALVSLAKSVKGLRLDLELLDATSELRYWQARNVPANQFGSLLNIIRNGIALDRDWQIDGAIDDILEILIKHRRDIDGPEITEMTELLNRLPEKHGPNVAKVMRAIR